MKFETARLAMVESQLRPNGVRDPLVLNAFATLPRECFVPEHQKALAYIDQALPVVAPSTNSPARYLLPPMVLGRMLQFAAPSPEDRVLDVGPVTGYSAAVLARICGVVDALEATDGLAEGMKRCLKSAGIDTVSVHSGKLNAGLGGSSFDLIVVNGAVSEEPKELLNQLADGGRLVTILRKGWFGQGCLYTKASGAVSGRVIFDGAAEILPGFEAKPQFVF